ncbi:MAG TPA: SLC13 family permease [Anaeromyxobacter sp.]|nr:SLC13 family permease [Anaeromyxobacter sp.]
MARTLLGASIFGATLLAIMVRPYRIPEAAAAAVGALAMMAAGIVAPADAVGVLAGQLNVYGFFLGLMTISAIADQAGVFTALAGGAGRWAGGSSRRLLVGTFAIGTVITAFLSNDATALILTPAVFALVTRLRLPVLPYMFACTFIADTASFLLPVSNPINILIQDGLGGGLLPFLRYLLLPALLCIGLNLGAFLYLFRADLRQGYLLADLPSTEPSHRPYLRATLAVLGIIAVAFVLATSLGVPVAWVALGGAAGLLVLSAVHRRLGWGRLRREISWSLFVFISGMFLVVRGVENLGLTRSFGTALVDLAGRSPLRASLLTAGGSALGANLINNVPMALVMVSALRSIGTTPSSHQGLIYAAMFGCDLGPNLTTVGSLATMLWLLILRRKGLEVSSVQYFKLGIALVPVMLLLGGVLIWLRS